MNAVAVIEAILGLVAGIGIFVIACSMMSENLESISSDKLKNLFSKVSNNKLIGVVMGTLGTAAIQSSGATMVMVIGFVNAGIMSLTQATTIMYGSDIGTTLTAQMVALGLLQGDSVSTMIIFSSMTGIGVITSALSKKDSIKKIGGILSGFGMLFIGLNMMSDSMEAFAMLEEVTIFLSTISNSILLVIIGAIMTAIIQSSSVMTSLSITMVFAGLISIDQGIFLTMGANIGSCVVGMIAGMTSGTNAKRTAIIQLIYNIGGVVLFMIIGEIIELFSGYSYGMLLNLIVKDSPEAQLAAFHLLFNVLSAIICLPFTKYLVKLSTIIVPESKDRLDKGTEHLTNIDSHMLKTPSIAVEQVKKEIIYMSNLAMDNFNNSVDSLVQHEVLNSSKFIENEEKLDNINEELTDFVSSLSRIVINNKDSIYLSKTYRTIMDFERIGDYAENIMEYSTYLFETNEKFSDDAIVEIKALKERVNLLYKYTLEAYEKETTDTLMDAELVEEEIDEMVRNMNINHIWRLKQHVCTAEVGAKFLSFASDAERIADHLINVAVTVKNNV